MIFYLNIFGLKNLKNLNVICLPVCAIEIGVQLRLPYRSVSLEWPVFGRLEDQVNLFANLLSAFQTPLALVLN